MRTATSRTDLREFAAAHGLDPDWRATDDRDLTVLVDGQTTTAYVINRELLDEGEARVVLIADPVAPTGDRHAGAVSVDLRDLLAWAAAPR